MQIIYELKTGELYAPINISITSLGIIAFDSQFAEKSLIWKIWKSEQECIWDWEEEEVEEVEWTMHFSSISLQRDRYSSLVDRCPPLTQQTSIQCVWCLHLPANKFPITISGAGCNARWTPPENSYPRFLSLIKTSHDY